MSAVLAIAGWYIVVGVAGIIAGYIGRWYWVEKRGHKA